MAIWKHTALFHYQSNPSGTAKGSRVAGWSESWLADVRYSQSDDAFDKLLKARATLLPVTSRIVGYRLSDILKKEGSKVHRYVIPGTWAAACDIPKMALQANGRGSTNNDMRMLLRGIPDTAVKEGEIDPQSTLIDKFNAYVPFLLPFYQMCRKLDADFAKIISISETGVVTLAENLEGLAVNNEVYILRPRTLNRGTFGGKYRVETVTNALSFKIRDWKGGESRGGTARKAEFVKCYYTNAMKAEQIVTRECGKPFFVYASSR